MDKLEELKFCLDHHITEQQIRHREIKGAIAGLTNSLHFLQKGVVDGNELKRRVDKLVETVNELLDQGRRNAKHLRINGEG